MSTTARDVKTDQPCIAPQRERSKTVLLFTVPPWPTSMVLEAEARRLRRETIWNGIRYLVGLAYGVRAGFTEGSVTEASMHIPDVTTRNIRKFPVVFKPDTMELVQRSEKTSKIDQNSLVAIGLFVVFAVIGVWVS
jgi:hypothetical protein